jgi:hypothetical protein
MPEIYAPSGAQGRSWLPIFNWAIDAHPDNGAMRQTAVLTQRGSWEQKCPAGNNPAGCVGLENTEERGFRQYQQQVFAGGGWFPTNMYLSDIKWCETGPGKCNP